MNSIENLQISELSLLNDSLERSHLKESMHHRETSTKTTLSMSILIVTSLLLLISINFTLDVYESYKSIAETSTVMAMLYLFLYLSAVIGILSYIIISIKNYMNLKVAFNVQARTLDAKSYEEEKRLALLILKHYTHHQDREIREKATLLFLEVKNNSVHAPFIDIKEKIINELDKQATAEIYSSAKEVSLFTAFAPAPALDSLAVIFSSLKLMKRIFYIYGYKTNLFTSLLIIRKILENASLAALVEYTDDSLNDLLGNTLLTKLSTKVAQGVGNGVLMLRVGNVLMQSARPFASNGSLGSYKNMLKLFIEYIKNKVGKNR